MTKRKWLKLILLFLFDVVFLAATLFCGYILFTKLSLGISELFIKVLPLFVVMKVIVYAAFGLYMDKDRSMLFEIVAVLFANAVCFFVNRFLFKVDIISYFYIYSFVVDLIFELISRSIFSFSSYDDEYEYEAETQNDMVKEKYNNKDMFDMDEFHQEVERKRNEQHIEDEDYEEEIEEDPITTLEDAIGKLDDITEEEEETKEIKNVIEPTIDKGIADIEEKIEEIEIEMPRLDINPGFRQDFEQKRIEELEKKLKEKENQLSILEGKLELNKKVDIDEYGEGIVRRKDDIDDLSKSFKQKEIIDNIFEDIKNLYSSLDAKAKAIKEQEDILITRLDALEKKQEEETEYEPSVRKRRKTRLTDEQLIALTDKKLKTRNENKKINKNNYYGNITNEKTESIIEDIEKIKMEISDMNKNTDVSYNYISEILHTNNSPFEDALLKKDKADSNESVKDIKQEIKIDNITNIKTLQDSKERKLNIDKKESRKEEKLNNFKEEQADINKQTNIQRLNALNDEEINKNKAYEKVKINEELENKREEKAQKHQKLASDEIENINNIDFLPDDIINDFKDVSVSKEDTKNDEIQQDKQKERQEQKKKDKKRKAKKRKPKQPKKNEVSNENKKSKATDTDELLKPMLAELKREITPKLVTKKPIKTNIIDFSYLSKSKLNVKKGDFEDISKLIDKI